MATCEDATEVCEPTGSGYRGTALCGGIPRRRIGFGLRRLRGKEPFGRQDDRTIPEAGLDGSHAQLDIHVVANDTDATQHHGFQIQLDHGNLRQSLLGGAVCSPDSLTMEGLWKDVVDQIL